MVIGAQEWFVIVREMMLLEQHAVPGTRVPGVRIDDVRKHLAAFVQRAFYRPTRGVMRAKALYDVSGRNVLRDRYETVKRQVRTNIEHPEAPAKTTVHRLDTLEAWNVEGVKINAPFF